MASHSANKRNTNSDVVDFSNNTVSNGANLFNIVIEGKNEGPGNGVEQLLARLEKMTRDRRPRRRSGRRKSLVEEYDESEEQEAEEDEHLAAFQSEWSLTSDADRASEDPNEVLDPSLHHGLSCQTNVSFRDSFFPGLRAFKGDAAAAVNQYPGPATASVMQSLSIPHQEELFAWAGSPHSQLLWMDGPLDSESGWTTDLALEVIGTVNLAISRQDTRDMVLVHHFCGPVVEGSRRNPEIIMQDLIFQLVTSQAEKFTSACSRDYRLTRSAFLEAAKPNNFRSLWRLFATCVYILKAKSLVIVLGDLDRLPGDTSVFRQLIDGLVKLSQTDNVQTKILVTTRPSFASDLFRETYTKTLRQVLAELPAAPDRRRTPTRSTRLFRLPIKAGLLHEMGINDASDFNSDVEGDFEEPDSVDACGAAALNRFADDEDSDLDYPDELGCYLDTESDEEDGKCIPDQDTVPRKVVDDVKKGTAIGQGAASAAGGRAVSRHHDNDSDDSLSYSDLNVATVSKESDNLKKSDFGSLASLLDDSSDGDEV